MRFRDFFDRVYILNLPERTDRLQYMSREMTKVGMSIECDDVEVFPAIKPDDKAPFPKLGSKGCFLSILKILKEAKSRGLSNLLILQDDAQFMPDFFVYEDQISKQLLESDWDIVQFGYMKLPSQSLPEKFVVPSTSEFGQLFPCVDTVIGAHCFAVNGKSLNSLIEFLEALLSRPYGHPDGGPMPIDGAFNVFSRQPNKMRLLLAPSLVGQANSRSDVTPNQYDRIPLLRQTLTALRQTSILPFLKRIFKNNNK